MTLNVRFLVLIYRDSERNGKYLIQKRSIDDFKRDLKKCQPKSQKLCLEKTLYLEAYDGIKL